MTPDMEERSHTRSDQVVRLDVSHAAQSVDVLFEAFSDYPVMRYMLGPAEGDYEDSLRRLIHYFVMARFLRTEPVLGVLDGSDAVASAIVTLPGDRQPPPEMAELREQVWAAIGPVARSRYEEYGEACLEFELDAPTYHLNMIGVREAARGRGLGRLLIEAVHRMSLDDALSTGVTLTTEVAENIPLYEHLGYEIIGHARFGVGVETWGFFRPDWRSP